MGWSFSSLYKTTTPWWLNETLLSQTLHWVPGSDGYLQRVTYNWHLPDIQKSSQYFLKKVAYLEGPMSKYLFSGGLRKVSNACMFSYPDTKTEKGWHHTYSWPRVLVLFAFLWLHKLQNTFDARTAHRHPKVWRSNRVRTTKRYKCFINSKEPLPFLHHFPPLPQLRIRSKRFWECFFVSQKLIEDLQSGRVSFEKSVIPNSTKFCEISFWRSYYI